MIAGCCISMDGFLPPIKRELVLVIPFPQLSLLYRDSDRRDLWFDEVVVVGVSAYGRAFSKFLTIF